MRFCVAPARQGGNDQPGWRVAERSRWGSEMLEIVTEAQIAAPPAKVWAVLTDFERYAQWHPWLAIRGVAAPGATVDCSLGVLRRRQIYSRDAQIKDFRDRALLSWEFGIRRVFVMEERFSIEQIGSGSSVRHSLKCRGLLVVLLGRAMRKRIDHLLRSADYALAGRLGEQRPVSPPAPASRPSGKRHHKRRKGRRRR